MNALIAKLADVGLRKSGPSPQSKNAVKGLQPESKMWSEVTKLIYEFVKGEESNLNVPCSKMAPPDLHVDDMDAEQVWQQLELKNNSLITSLRSNDSLEDYNLCLMVADLCNKVNNPTDSEVETNVQSDDEGVETGDESVDLQQGDDLTSDLESDDGINSKDKIENFDEDDLSEKAEGEDFSDLDADTFGDIALEEEKDDEEDEDNNEEQEAVKYAEQYAEKKNIPNEYNKKNFQASNVDTRFLNLRECEWVADNDIIGKGFDSDEDNIDLMEDLNSDQSDDEAKEAMYDTLFDPPNDNQSKFMESNKEESPLQDPSANTLEEQRVKKSRFEENLEKESNRLVSIEKEFFLEEKPWMLKGEIEKDQRPENSALEQQLEYNVAIRLKPIITEATDKNIEKLLLSRIKTQSWDDVERTVKPKGDPFQLKKALILDQEKSKKSLSTIYEEEFIRKQEEKNSGKNSGSSVLLAKDDKSQEVLPIHKEIKAELEDLLMSIHALSNYHYTPRNLNAEVKVVSNLPAITIEESTPTTASDATLLAPQEIMGSARGELKGETEKNETDKKRERRLKKQIQKAKAKREQDKLKHQMKKTDKNGLLGVDTSAKLVEKAVSKGQIKVLDGRENVGNVKNSTVLFNQLSDNISGRINKRKFGDGSNEGETKKRKKTKLTVSQLLL